MKRRAPQGFSLVEVLTVITIIVILAGMVIGGSAYVKEKQAREKARVQIHALCNAIEEYRTDMGDYPGGGVDTAVDGDASEILYQALFKDGYDYTNPSTPPDPWTKATKIYLPDLDPRTTKQGWVTVSKAASPADNLKIKDPWGHNYLYRVGKNAQNPDFDLWSMGKDGKTDATNPDVNAENNKDDIRP